MMWGCWLAQTVEHVTLDLRVVSLSPTLRVEFTLKQYIDISIDRYIYIQRDTYICIYMYIYNVKAHTNDLDMY